MNVSSALELADHLTLGEIMCRCGCGAGFGHIDLLKAWVALREMANRPIRINSGFRCPDYNREVGGTPTSRHQFGKALDVRFDTAGWSEEQLYCMFLDAGFFGVGRGQEGAWWHLDMRPAPAFWLYAHGGNREPDELAWNHYQKWIAAKG